MCVFCGPRVNFSGGCLHLQIQILRLTKAVAGLHGFPPQRRVPEVTTGRGACAGRGQDHGTKGTPLGPVDPARCSVGWAAPVGTRGVRCRGPSAPPTAAPGGAGAPRLCTTPRTPPSRPRRGPQRAATSQPQNRGGGPPA